MSFNYAAKAAKAAKKIMKYGARAVLARSVPGGEYDPVLGSMLPGSEERHGVFVVLESPTVKLVGETPVLAGDMVANMGVPGLAVIPGAGDSLEIGSECWMIMAEMHVRPGGEYVLYRVLVRK